MDIEKILPHKKPMIFIDDIIEINIQENYVITSVKITEDKIFFNRKLNGISPLTGIEYMAQTIGCYAYYKNNEQPPKIGFLLGTRSYKNNIEKFENGTTYAVKAKEVYADNELVSFECFIYNGDMECASASINAFMPENVDDYINGI